MEKYSKSLVLAALVFLVYISGLSCASPPKVIKTIPENGDRNVDPGLKQIRIEFDQDMMTGGFSICGGGPKYPKTQGRPKWINKRTLVLNVNLEKNHEYQISVNCPSYRNCKGANGESAEIYPVSFKTGSGAATANNHAESPAVLLQQGRYAEETEGNLDKAMEIYEQIRAEYSSIERIAAIATYQLAVCHLKKDQQSEANYSRKL